MGLFGKITSFIKHLFSMAESTPQQQEISKVALVLKARQERLELETIEHEIEREEQTHKRGVILQFCATLAILAELKEIEQEINDQMMQPQPITPEEQEQPEPIHEPELVAVGERVESLPATPDTLRIEVNRLTMPFFALNDRDIQQEKGLSIAIAVEINGEPHRIEWLISGHQQLGRPGPFDKKVDTAIVEIVNEQTPPLRNPIGFSTYDLCKQMGVNPNGRTYAQVRNSLERIVGTTYKGALYSKAKKRWLTDIFHLYDRVKMRGEELPDGTLADRNYIWLSQWALDHYNGGYTRPLQHHLYKELANSPIAQRLYELLGVKFYGVLNGGGQFYNIAYKELCQLLPVKEQQEHKYAKRNLKNAHDELIVKNYLEKVEWRGWTLYYYPGEQVFKELEQSRGAESPFRLAASQDPIADLHHTEIVQELKTKLGFADQNDGFYHLIAHRVPHDVIRMCLKDVEEDERAGRIKETKAQLFNHYLQQSCTARGIELNLKQTN